MKKVLVFMSIFFLSSGFLLSQKFAFVDTKYILEHIPEYQQALNTLDELSLQWQKELEQKYAEIDKMYKAYQNEAFLLSEEMKKKRQEEIINKEKEVKELQKKYFGTEGELFKKRQELIRPIQEKVYNAIEQIATEGNYAIIFDRAGSTTVIYANDKYDKSDEVLQKLGYKK
ncbi:MAG: OmpH family outer membrane protein [Bacteroidales bacterium]|nr:OmpH family outer membrane protein [Bacteroidales bacterium]